MVFYIIRRLLQSLIVLLGVTLIVFVLVEVAGDPVVLMLSGTGATQEELEAMRRELGYDRPAPVRYATFLVGVLQGDTGRSLRYRRPAMGLVMNRMPATLKLTALSLLLSLLVSLPVGVITALRRGTAIDHAGRALVLIGQAVPNFWLGMLLILFFASGLRWFPSGGYGSWQHYVLPTISLGMFPMARFTRLIRSSMLEVLSQDYIRTAKAKGMPINTVIYVHALRNAIIPAVTDVAFMFGVLLGGAVVTETIFSWPGVGWLSVQAIYQRDFPLVQSSVIVVASGFVLINLIVDILYTVIDPRIEIR